MLGREPGGAFDAGFADAWIPASAGMMTLRLLDERLGTAALSGQYGEMSAAVRNHSPHHDHCDHDHGHDHGHPHADDGGSVTFDAERRTLIALAVTFLFMLVEAGGGLVSGSLALLADAAHMLADVMALGMAWGAFRLGRLAADHKRSYGYRRVEVLAALLNGATVAGLSVGIVAEAIERLLHPETVQGWPMLVVAVIGLAANAISLKVLGGHAHHGHDHGRDDHDHGPSNLNLRGAWLHVLGDLLGAAAAVGAAIVILVNGWTPIDPILSILMAVLIFGSGIKLFRQAAHILLEGSPAGFDTDALRRTLRAEVTGLVDIHHVHAWSVTSGQPMLTLHAVVDPAAPRDAVLAGVKHVLAEDFGFAHSVVQIEAEDCGDQGKACG
jgi:cobalt-zinc-cadmium efflux system protein